MKDPGVAVRCRGVTKEFASGEGRVRALDRVDLSASAGELTLLAGPSGCGKTTLISIVAGLLDPTAGEVQVLGEELTRLTASRLIAFRRRHIGFVFQSYNLLPALTAAENVAVPLLIAGESRQSALESARAGLKDVGLEARAGHLPAQLSGGQQQRVAIARALIHAPRLLVCDEPTAALDAHSGRVAMELLAHVAAGSDRAVLVVSHDHRVFEFADQLVTLADGRVERTERRREASVAA